MTYNFLIVDDEKLSRLYIRKLLTEFLPDANIYEARNKATAKEILLENVIDIVLLDIQMPGATGFDLLSELKEHSFETVIISAYNQYGIDAVKAGACDYLLKPVSKNEFRAMLQKVLKLKSAKVNTAGPGDLQQQGDQAYLNKKMAIHQQTGIKFIALADISFLKAWNTYTAIHQLSGEVTMASKPISKFEKSLDSKWFFRVHKSYIVNLKGCAEFNSAKGLALLMKDGTQIPVSRYRLKEFIKILNSRSDFLNP